MVSSSTRQRCGLNLRVDLDYGSVCQHTLLPPIGEQVLDRLVWECNFLAAVWKMLFWSRNKRKQNTCVVQCNQNGSVVSKVKGVITSADSLQLLWQNRDFDFLLKSVNLVFLLLDGEHPSALTCLVVWEVQDLHAVWVGDVCSLSISIVVDLRRGSRASLHSQQNNHIISTIITFEKPPYHFT